MPSVTYPHQLTEITVMSREDGKYSVVKTCREYETATRWKVLYSNEIAVCGQHVNAQDLADSYQELVDLQNDQ